MTRVNWAPLCAAAVAMSALLPANARAQTEEPAPPPVEGAPAEPEAASPPAEGSIDGKIVDANGAPFANVTVTARDERSGAVFTGATDAEGRFVITGVTPGGYEVTAREPGGLFSVTSGVVVRAGSPTNADFRLEPAPPTPPPVSTPPSSPSTTAPVPDREVLMEAPGGRLLSKTNPPMPSEASDQEPPPKLPTIELYGHAQLDLGYEFFQSDPLWFDVARPTKLPSVQKEFGDNGHIFMGVRQSRFGVKGFYPTGTWLGELKTQFEFELFGVGPNAGQTTFRLRHAWGEIWQIGAGQTWSVFMDPDVFPDSLEYWGPNGMVFFRNVQLRWTPISNDVVDAMISAEGPGGAADAGVAGERIDLSSVTPRFPMPDFAAHVRLKGDWGHVQAAGIFRYIEWDDNRSTGNVDVTGAGIGYGLNLSANFKIWKDTLRLQAVGGSGIENYMNDAGADIGAKNNSSDVTRPILGAPLPVLGVVAFLDHSWSDQFSSTIGYSLVEVLNSDAQDANAFQSGQYALANVMWRPVPTVMFGAEVQWVWRRNKSNGFYANDVRIQTGFKYSFDFELEGKKQ